MSTLTMPSISVIFQTAALNTIRRAQRGIVALILRDAALKDQTYSLTSSKMVPATMGTANQEVVRRAFLGYVNPPSKVLIYVMDAADTIAADGKALKWLETQSFNYLAGPPDISAAEAAILKTWTISQRANNHSIAKAVLPNIAGDSVAIINVTTAGSKVGGTVFDAAAYCGRIAGILAGTPAKISGTYAPLPEVEDVTRLTEEEMDAVVGTGGLLWFYDGDKVKLGRAVNSLTTVTKGLTDDWKFVKIVDIIDMADRDIRLAIADGFIGKKANTYANKQLMVASVREYLQQLYDQTLIGAEFSADVDVDAQETYLQSKGIDTSKLTEQQIREADTDTHVFLAVSMHPVNAIEDVVIRINL